MSTMLVRSDIKIVQGSGRLTTRKTRRGELEREQEPEVVDTPLGENSIPKPLDFDTTTRSKPFYLRPLIRLVNHHKIM